MIFPNDIKSAIYRAWDITHDHNASGAGDLQSNTIKLDHNSEGLRVSSLISREDIEAGLPGLSSLLLLAAVMFVTVLTNDKVEASAFLAFGPILLFVVFSILSSITAIFVVPYSYATMYIPAAGAILLSGSTTSAIAAFAGICVGMMFEQALVNSTRIAKHDADAGGEARVAEHRSSDIAKQTLERQRKTVSRQNKNKDLVLGKAFGVTRNTNDDEFGYDYGQDVILNVDDLGHVFIAGETGSGKTFGLIRPIALSWIEAHLREREEDPTARRAGLLILCGKNALPFDFEGVPGHRMIHPDKDVLAPMQGLSASKFCTAITAKEGGGKSDYFEVAGESVFRQCAFLLEYVAHKASNPKPELWCMRELYELIQDDKAKTNMAVSVEADLEKQRSEGKIDQGKGVYDGAVKYMSSYAETADNERSGIRNTALNFLRPFSECQETMAWFNAHEGVDPTAVLRGGIVSVAIPESYGRVSELFVKLIYARVMQTAMDRLDENKWSEGDGNTRCMIVTDECQKIVDDTHVQAIAVCRSKGIRLVYCTQTVSALENALGGKEAADEFMGNLNHALSLKSNARTYDWMSDKMGTLYRPVTKQSVYINVKDDEWRSKSAMKGTSLLDLREGFSDATKMLGLSKHGDALTNDAENIMRKGGRGGVMEYDLLPAITAEEMSNLLNCQFTAVAAIKRGGSMRRDLIDLFPTAGNYTPENFTQRLIDTGLMTVLETESVDSTAPATLTGNNKVTPTEGRPELDETEKSIRNLIASAKLNREEQEQVIQEVKVNLLSKAICEAGLRSSDERQALIKTLNPKVERNGIVRTLSIPEIVKNGKIELMANLMAQAPDLFLTNNNSSKTNALMAAAVQGNGDIFDAVLSLYEGEVEAINAKDSKGRSVLAFAISSKNFENAEKNRRIKLLVEAGADVFAKSELGENLLFNAVQRKNLNAVNLLVELGVNPNEEDDDGGTPLDLAKDLGLQVLVDAMKQAGSVER